MSQVYMSEVMDYVNGFYDNFLEHHGILGQRWGILRFQNKDGSWTTVGLKRRAKLAKLTAGYEFSKASLKGSKAAKAFIKNVSEQYNNTKIDALDYVNKKGVFDKIYEYQNTKLKDLYESSKPTQEETPSYKVDYAARESNLANDVSRISSYFNPDSSTRKSKISDYVKNNADESFYIAKDRVSGARKRAMDNFESNLKNSETGRTILDTARSRAVESFASNISNYTTSQIMDPANWDAEYSRLGNRYVSELANVRF